MYAAWHGAVQVGGECVVCHWDCLYSRELCRRDHCGVNALCAV